MVSFKFIYLISMALDVGAAVPSESHFNRTALISRTPVRAHLERRGNTNAVQAVLEVVQSIYNNPTFQDLTRATVHSALGAVLGPAVTMMAYKHDVIKATKKAVKADTLPNAVKALLGSKGSGVPPTPPATKPTLKPYFESIDKKVATKSEKLLNAKFKGVKIFAFKPMGVASAGVALMGVAASGLRKGELAVNLGVAATSMIPFVGCATEFGAALYQSETTWNKAVAGLNGLMCVAADALMYSGWGLPFGIAIHMGRGVLSWLMSEDETAIIKEKEEEAEWQKKLPKRKRAWRFFIDQTILTTLASNNTGMKTASSLAAETLPVLYHGAQWLFIAKTLSSSFMNNSLFNVVNNSHSQSNDTSSRVAKRAQQNPINITKEEQEQLQAFFNAKSTMSEGMKAIGDEVVLAQRKFLLDYVDRTREGHPDTSLASWMSTFKETLVQYGDMDEEDTKRMQSLDFSLPERVEIACAVGHSLGEYIKSEGDKIDANTVNETRILNPSTLNLNELLNYTSNSNDSASASSKDSAAASKKDALAVVKYFAAIQARDYQSAEIPQNLRSQATPPTSDFQVLAAMSLCRKELSWRPTTNKTVTQFISDEVAKNPENVIEELLKEPIDEKNEAEDVEEIIKIMKVPDDTNPGSNIQKIPKKPGKKPGSSGREHVQTIPQRPKTPAKTGSQRRRSLVESAKM